MISREDEQKIKEKLLQSLISHMDDQMGEKMRPHKAMEVSVAAPDKEKLVEGLSKAKELMDSGELGSDHPESEGSDEPSSDEDRLMDLADRDSDGSEDDEDERPTRRW